MSRRGPGGSEQDPTVEGRVLDAVYDAVGRHGIHEISMHEVAQLAGVSKTTMYTRWPDKHSLLLAAFRHFALGPVAPDNGDHGFESRLDAVTNGAITAAADPRLRRMLLETFAAASLDEEIRHLLFERQANWRAMLTLLIEQGQAEGLVPAHRDAAATAEAMMAITTLRLFAGDLPVDDAFAAQLRALVTDEHPL